LGEALDVCGKDLESIVVGTGPGSYTGVRIGIAAAQGLGWSRGVPVFGLPSVLAPDLEVIPPAFTVCGDARRTQFYAARVQDGCLAAGAIPLMDAGALAALHESDGGSCWITFDEKIPAHLEGVRCVRPSASHLATLASRFSGEELRARGAAALEPVYLSAPFITQAKKR
jgi:tRNA threonylcarbamoyl adenosine modification protein YeaZ